MRSSAPITFGRCLKRRLRHPEIIWPGLSRARVIKRSGLASGLALLLTLSPQAAIQRAAHLRNYPDRPCNGVGTWGPSGNLVEDQCGQQQTPGDGRAKTPIRSRRTRLDGGSVDDGANYSQSLGQRQDESANDRVPRRISVLSCSSKRNAVAAVRLHRNFTKD
jgi:hypothetical protein